MYSKIILPASLLTGTLIGAGMFSLPFVFQKSGLATGLFYLSLFTILFILVYIFYVDVVVRTPGQHRFLGYSKMYLGRWGFVSAIFINLMQMLFVLTIYLILAPSFSRLFIADGLPYHFLGFWILGSIAILFNTKRIALAEFIINIGIGLIIALIFILGAPRFFASNFEWTFLPSNFLAVGPLIFALSASVAVPEMVSYFRESKIPLTYLRRSLILGTFLPAVVYFLFAVGIIGLSPSVSGDAVSGLINKVPAFILGALGILGFLSLVSSYIVIGLNTRRIFQYDLSAPSWLSKILVIFTPIIFYILGFRNFIEAVSFVGRIFLPLESILIIFIWLSARQKLKTPSFLTGRWSLLAAPVVLAAFFIVLIYAILK